MKYLILICSFWICNIVSAQGQKDTLYFNNGSIVIGELKKIKLGVVTFDPDDANDITIQLRKIKSIYAGSKVFRVESIHNVAIFGIIKPDSADRQVKIIDAGQVTSIYLEDISNLYPFENQFKQRFSGAVGFGYSYTRSSDFGRLNFDGSLNYMAKAQELKLSFSGIYTATDTGFTRDREEVNFKDNFYFSPRSFATLLLSYQKNLELGLDRRYQEGAGIGNKFITSKNIYAWARGGIVFNQEKSTEGEYSGLLTELFAQLQFNLFRFSKPEINLNMAQTFYISLSEKGRYRNDGSTTLAWEMIKDLDLSLELYNNFDSKPPVSGGSTFDFGIVLGLKYSF